MRDIDKIIIHCSATPEGKHFDALDIDRWHKKRGWAGIGYHFVILLNGDVTIGRHISRSGAHTKGHNKGSIGVCYIGGVDANGKPKDTRTPEQKEALRELCKALQHDFRSATIHGHNEFSNKACPSFNVKKEI